LYTITKRQELCLVMIWWTTMSTKVKD